MALLAAKADGNFTSASTWYTVDSTSLSTAETSSHAVTTAYSGTRSSAFTPGAITIDGIGLRVDRRTGSTGTITACLELDSGDTLVTGTDVTVDVTDLPNITVSGDLSAGWVFFKFAAPVTLLAATAYQVAVKTSSASQVNLYRDGTAANVSRYLRTTTSPGSVAAGDDFIIAREMTGSGTGNDRTVTMDSTASTDYGSASTALTSPAISINNGGTLTYGTSASTNYVLRVSGHIIVSAGGTLSIGTTGTPIPRTSTAVLEFDCPSAAGDFGLVVRQRGTFIAQGLSRTSGKNVVMCRLNSTANASDGTLTVDADTGWLSGDTIAVAATSRTMTDAEEFTLASDATYSAPNGTLTLSGTLARAHEGGAASHYARAHVINVTRNVKVRAVTSSNPSFITNTGCATIDCDWVEFSALGSTGTGKASVFTFWSGAWSVYSTGSFNLDFCSFNQVPRGGLATQSGQSNVYNEVYINDCVFYKNANTFAAFGLGSPVLSVDENNSTLQFYRNIALNWEGAGNLHVFNPHPYFDVQDCVVAGGDSNAGAGAIAIAVGNTSTELVGLNNASGLEVYSFQGGPGFGLRNISHVRPGKAITLLAWRGDSTATGRGGLQISYCGPGLVVDSMEAIGVGSGLTLSTVVDDRARIKSLKCYGESAGAVGGPWAMTNGVVLGISGGRTEGIVIDNYDSTASGNKTSPSVDVLCFASTATLNGTTIFNNPTFAASTELSNIPAGLYGRGRLSIQRKDGVDDAHTTYYQYGTVTCDTTIYSTAAPSMRLTPSSGTYRQEVPVGYITVNDGGTRTVSLQFRASEFSADGTDYAGYGTDYPRLIAKANPSVGLTADVVIDTMTTAFLPGGASEATWETLTGTLTATGGGNFVANGQVEIVIDALGTAGWINVDDLSVS